MIKDFKEYQNKKKQLIKYNKFYYDKSAPKIDDATYDKLKNELIIFEKKTKH